MTVNYAINIHGKIFKKFTMILIQSENLCIIGLSKPSEKYNYVFSRKSYNWVL